MLFSMLKLSEVRIHRILTNQIIPFNLICLAESVKESIRITASEFMKVMPAFVRRLAQREYDMLLVRPVKRRLLLKLYCLGRSH